MTHQYKMSSAISRALAIIVVVVIIVAAAVAVYLLYPTITGTTTQTGTVAIALEIGAADASDVPQIYAMTHYLPQFGYTANLNIFTGQSAADAALISGSAQVLLGVANEGPALSSKGVDILTFGTAYSETDEILVCTGNITSMGQLAQQHVTVGMTSLTDISYVVPDVYLATHGYNASSVNWIIVPGAAGRGAALLSGKIPCGATDVTSTLELLAQPNNKFHILATLASLEPQFPFIMWMTTKSFFSSHQSLLTVRRL
jgi:ABC-type nitrate/sulfonate/bicarbonate transport system substrate-binding protein